MIKQFNETENLEKLDTSVNYLVLLVKIMLLHDGSVSKTIILLH